MSHPSWVCGLKQSRKADTNWLRSVTPFVGVWIETKDQIEYSSAIIVTPFVGVWIETLKENGGIFEHGVTPFVGVWIET